MFGGTAKTYIEWKWLDKPFKENGRLYIMVEHPTTKLPKKVRFYEDRAHDDLKPKQASTPLHKVFGFESKDSNILIISDSAVTDDFKERNLHRKWRITRLFGDTWYAPLNTEVSDELKPYIKFVSWRDFVAEARKDASPTSCWFKEGVL